MNKRFSRFIEALLVNSILRRKKSSSGGASQIQSSCKWWEFGRTASPFVSGRSSATEHGGCRFSMPSTLSGRRAGCAPWRGWTGAKSARIGLSIRPISEKFPLLKTGLPGGRRPGGSATWYFERRADEGSPWESVFWREGISYPGIAATIAETLAKGAGARNRARSVRRGTGKSIANRGLVARGIMEKGNIALDALV